jgi:AcrR family transcriptional regulator
MSMAKKAHSAGATTTARRSDASRARILEAARQTFAELGYDRATIRTIAERANIHPSMVMRYFESKEGLFTASSQFDLALPDFSKVPPKRLGEFIIRTFLDRWENRRGAADMPALLRLSVTHPEGREKAIAIFARQVRPLLVRVIRSADPTPRAALIATQLVGLAFLRYVLRLPAVVELSEAYLVEHMGSTIQRYIDAG